jgi:hypothetical protein
MTHVSFDWIIWSSTAAGLSFLAIAAASSGTRRQNPWFTWHLAGAAITNIASIFVWLFLHNFRLYGQVVQVSSVINLALIGAAIIEIWHKTFGPSRALPPWTTFKFVAALAAAYPTCVLVAQLCRARTGNAFAASLWTIELIITSIAATTVLMLVSYSRKLNITWRPIHERIAMGFAISLSASAFAALAAGRLVGMLTAQRFSQIAYIVALGVWGWALSTRDVPEEKLDIGTLRTLWRDMNETQAELTVR